MSDRAADRIAEASAVRPSARQLAWQRREFYGFLHFGMNTMTDAEWGLGHEDPALFDPVDLDADEWVRALKSAGMTAAILTCKHHDGFCLWPSDHTGHTVAASPWRGGRGDVVAEVAAACAAHGLGFGVYLSPWDRTDPRYGTGVAYDDYFVAQLTELLTRYGPIACVWLDGANGEGESGARQFYDWDRYYAVIRELQPDAVISVCGPDVRWCGNEAGHTRADEWSVVPASLRDAERTASLSQQVDDGRFSRQVRSDEEDLGSRAALLSSDEPLVWYPAEVNTSIRPGWFHHPAEDGEVRSAAELFAIHRRSVGGNSTFLLNVPPDRRGRIAEPDVAELAALGALLSDQAARDLGVRATTLGPESLPTLRLVWDDPVIVGAVVVEEDIAHGQQIDGLSIIGLTPEGGRVDLARVSAVGHRRIVEVDPPVALVGVEARVDAARGPVHGARLRALAAS